MADITIMLTDDINTAVGRTYGYQETVDDGESQIPNPVTPDQFTQQIIENFLTNIVTADAYSQATDAARAQVDASLQATPITVQTSLKT